MRNPPVIENIEELRRRAGIEDVELREEILGLAVGDVVRLTLLSGTKSPAGQTVLVRITGIRDGAFRGEVVGRPAPAGPSGRAARSSVAFTAAHIHSVVKGRAAHEP
jgi:hypothetical protein